MSIADRIAGWVARDSLGVVVVDDALHACLMRRDQPIWSGTHPWTGSEPLSHQLRMLAEQIPRSRNRRRDMRVAIGSSRVIVKRLPDFSASDIEARYHTVRDFPERYFIAARGAIVASEAFATDSGDVWAAGFLADDITELRLIAKQLSWRKLDVVPTRALGELTDDVHSEDGDRLAQVAASRTTPSRMRANLPLHHNASGRHRLVRQFAAVTALAACYGSGYAAHEVLSWRSDVQRQAVDQSTVLRVRAQLDSVRQIERALEQVGAFSRSHPSLVLRLTDIATALEGAAVINRLAIADSTIEVSLLATEGTEIPGKLKAIPWIRDVRLIGGYVREGDTSLRQRVSLSLTTRTSTLVESSGNGER